jgi:hypothetical protein
MRRFITPHPFRCAWCGAALLTLCRCLFDADLPLENDPPACTNRSEIRASLVYPDSSLCTLSIIDRNDAALSLRELPCGGDEATGVPCDSQHPQPWAGSFEFLSTGYAEKRLRLSFGTNRMGVYRGMLLLADAASATLRLPYTIEKIFLDPFDAFPLSATTWQPYHRDDPLHLGFDYIDKKLTFSFTRSGDTSGTPLSTGIRTRFSLPSAFHATIDFKLRDEMDDAFEVAFFISSSSDTGRWAGDKAGSFITGNNGRLRIECRSINLQSYSYESGTTAGELGISRTDSTISYYFHDGNPAVIPKPLATQLYPADIPVYVHLKMTVRDHLKDRHCSWNDFTISSGTIVFPSD